MMKKFCLAALSLLLFLPVALIAQNGGFAGAATHIGFGPRGMAMGNAFTAVTSEGIYPYYNPALAAEKTELRQSDFSVSSLQFDRIYQTANVHLQLPPNAGIALGLIRSGVKDIDERSLSGYPLGTFDLSEYQLYSAFGIRFSEKIQGGVSFKINYANYHRDLTPATAVGVDIGFLYKLSKIMQVGITVQDMFANYTWNSGDVYGLSQSRNVVNNFPTRFKLGVAYQKELYTVSAEYEIQSYTSEVEENFVFIDDDLNPQRLSSLETLNTSSGMFRLGGSWLAHERFTIRAGYRLSDATNSASGAYSTGFSVHLPFDTFAPSIDYAFVREPFGVANMHVFALRLHL
jgi:hypothetical protein